MAAGTKWLSVYAASLGLVGACCVLGGGWLVYRAHQYGQSGGPRCVGAAAALCCVGALALASARLAWRAARSPSRLPAVGVVLATAVLAVGALAALCWAVAANSARRDDLTAKLEAMLAAGELDAVQSELECCGVGGPTDYRANRAVPWSCCTRLGSDDTSGDCSSVHQRGCLAQVYDFAFDTALYTAAASFAVALFLLLGSVAFFPKARTRSQPMRSPATVGLMSAPPKR